MEPLDRPGAKSYQVTATRLGEFAAIDGKTASPAGRAIVFGRAQVDPPSREIRRVTAEGVSLAALVLSVDTT
jgi:hypothetical protein